MNPPQCFISYSWDNEDHSKWVRFLGEKLVRNGVETLLDQWDGYPGMDLQHYMESSIRASDYVIIVCTPNYAGKANSSEGGVGYEKNIISGDLFNRIGHKKYIPILRSGKDYSSLPTYLKSKLCIDFRKDSKFPEALDILLRHIYQKKKYSPPPLGEAPVFGKSYPTVKSAQNKIKAEVEAVKPLVLNDQNKKDLKRPSNNKIKRPSKTERKKPTPSKLNMFNRDQVLIVQNAVSMSEELVNNYYKMPKLWLAKKYDVKTLVDLAPDEIVEGPFGQIIGYKGKTSSDRSTYIFYNICIMDHSIIKTISNSSEIQLFPFMVYNVSQLLILIVRFSKFLVSFEASIEERMSEQAKVHRLTNEMLEDKKIPGIEAVLTFFKGWLDYER